MVLCSMHYFTLTVVLHFVLPLVYVWCFGLDGKVYFVWYSMCGMVLCLW